MTKKSLILLGVGSITCAILIGGIAGVSSKLHSELSYNNEQAKVETHLIKNPNDPLPMPNLVVKPTKIVSQTPQNGNLVVKLGGLSKSTIHNFMYKTSSEKEYTTTKVTSNEEGTVDVTIANYRFGEVYTYKITENDKVVQEEYQVVVSLLGPFSSIETTGNTAEIKFYNMTNYSGVLGEELKFEYKLKEQKDFRVLIGPFDIPLGKTTFSLSLKGLLPNREYEWKLSRKTEKIEIQKGSFKTKNS